MGLCRRRREEGTARKCLDNGFFSSLPASSPFFWLGSLASDADPPPRTKYSTWRVKSRHCGYREKGSRL